MVLALDCLQALAALAFILSPEGPPRLQAVADLTEGVAEAVRLLETTPAVERRARLDALAAARDVHFEVAPRPDGGGEASPGWPLSGLQPLLAERLGPGRTVIVRRHRHGPMPPPIDPPVGSGAAAMANYLFPDFSVSVSLADGAWLLVRPPPDPRDAARLLRLVGLLAASVLLVALVAVRTARSLVAPLQRLAAAAERLGRERVSTPVEDLAIPEFAAIARAFDEMQGRIKRFVDDRTLMLAAISHDLRTPLTRLRLMAEDETDPGRRAQILDNIAEMEGMVSATLAFASDDTRREPHERVDVAALLISLCDAAADAGQDVRYGGPDHVVLPCAPALSTTP